MVIDLNREHLAQSLVNVRINDLIEQSEPPEPNTRQYLGASSIGSVCLRKVHFDWLVDAKFKSRTRDIFARGHFHEALSRDHLIKAGFRFEADQERFKFKSAIGQISGHADGILIDGPKVDGLRYPAIWEHKAINKKGWQDLERDGLLKAYPHYAAQVWLYMAYLGLPDNPALFTAINCDSCERLHVLVEFDLERAQLWSDRAVGIIKATRAGELLPRFTTNPKDFRCARLCGHRERCWRAA
jgi:hypothetical protein